MHQNLEDLVDLLFSRLHMWSNQSSVTTATVALYLSHYAASISKTQVAFSKTYFAVTSFLFASLSKSSILISGRHEGQQK